MYTVPCNLDMAMIIGNWYVGISGTTNYSDLLEEEYGVTFGFKDNVHVICFPSESDFIMFVMKYS